MKKEIELSILGSHQEIDSGEKEDIKTKVKATYIQKDGLHYIFYDEKQEGSIIKNRVVIEPGVSVDIIKRGAISSDMHLFLNKKMETEYKTPFMTMNMSFDTKKLILNVSDQSLYLEVEYVIGIEGKDHANCSVIMES